MQNAFSISYATTRLLTKRYSSQSLLLETSWYTYATPSCGLGSLMGVSSLFIGLPVITERILYWTECSPVGGVRAISSELCDCLLVADTSLVNSRHPGLRRVTPLAACFNAWDTNLIGIRIKVTISRMVARAISSASVDGLTEMLSRDEIPLISTVDLITNNYSGPIPLVGHKSNTLYIAISHVWSDHRGNPRANALPTCQLQFLIDCVQKLCPDLPPSTLPNLWIDTICCPVSPLGP